MVNKNNDKKTKGKITFIISVIVLATLFLVVMVFLIINQMSSVKVICSKNGTSINGVKQNNEIEIELKKNRIVIISENKKIMLDKIPTDFDALDVIKRALEEEYKKIGITYKVESNKDHLVVGLTYTKEKKYILDNIMVSLETDGIGINVIQEDKKNNYLSVDFGKEYNKDSIISIFENNDYLCK